MSNSELENYLSELRSLCEHLERRPSPWQRIKARVIDWWRRKDVGETLIGFAVWIGLFVGVPLLLSMCDSKKSLELKSPHGDTIGQYTVSYYADGSQDCEEVTDDQ